MPSRQVHITGITGSDASCLPPSTINIIKNAELLFGGERLLTLFPHFAGQKVAIKNNLGEVAQLIKENMGKKRIVVLASGDPGFHGIASYLATKLGKEALEIIPALSPLQLAFARIKESWGDAVLASVHSRPIDEVVGLVRRSRKVCLLTDDHNTPSMVAAALKKAGVDNRRAYVCQDMGSKEEAVFEADLYELIGRDFSPLNVMIIVKKEPTEEEPPQPLFGLPDDTFTRRMPGKGLITKREVRAVSLASLRLTPQSTVWDIGAGSGAVSIEAASLASLGSVYAVEKDAESVAIIRENIAGFGRDNITVVEAEAPEGLDALPQPDAVFIGGSGSRIEGILDTVCRRLKEGGRIVINAATLENLQAAISGLKNNSYIAEIALVNIATSRDIAGLTRFEALNPVFVITGSREENLAAQ